jgi:hypothetical protein
VALRDKVVLRAVGYTLVALSILAFAAYLVLKVVEGQALETYHSGSLVRWNYGAALAAFVALACAAAIAGVIRFVSWFKVRRELSRLARDNSEGGSGHG